jgi:glycosyltransferase involved in cell wall biosynthesis
MSDHPHAAVFAEKIKALNCCIIIPTYNNAHTLADVIKDVLLYTSQVIVVNDGSTDTTMAVLKQFSAIEVISYVTNKGKGIALRTGITRAQEKGYRYAITIDSDGQHFAKDIPYFLFKINHAPDSLLIGARNLNQEHMPKKNTFGNKFSNFWVLVSTGLNLPDTQSGYRLYPLEKMKGMRFFSSKYEFEVEVLVKLSWKDVPVYAVPVQVFYAEEGKRVSHFRPGKDFTRIGILYTYLVTLALIWYKPIKFLSHFSPKNIRLFLKKQFLDSDESIARKSMGVAFGIFMGIIPIWGYQLISSLVLAHLLKLNKAIVGVAANISIPPMIPFLLYGSLKTGQFVLRKNLSDNIFNSEVTFETIKQHLLEYVIGSCVFAVVMATLFGGITYLILKFKQTKRSQQSL